MKHTLWIAGFFVVVAALVVWALAVLAVGLVAFALYLATCLAAFASDALVLVAERMGRCGKRACDWYASLLR